MRIVAILVTLALTACGGGGGDDTSGGIDSDPPVIHLTSVALTGSTDRSALVDDLGRSDEDSAPRAHRFTRHLGSGGIPADPLGGGTSVTLTFDCTATTSAGSDRHVVTVEIEP